MDPDPPSQPRKVRFTPKGPPRRKAKPTAPKAEKADDNREEEEAEQAKLLRRANEHLGGRGPKVEKKSSSVQVAFAHGAGSSTSIRSFGKQPREGNGDKSNDFGSARENREIVVSSPSTATTDGAGGSSINAVDISPQKIKKEYKEPWDYENSYYPITLPLRRPYSGDPELLDEDEFGGASEDVEYNEKAINAAKELDLLVENEEERVIFIQLPSCGNRADARKGNASYMGSTSEESQGGPMGKMLIYKSGAVKWKIGESLYDVSPGCDTNFQQHVMAIDTVDKECCMLGALDKQAVVTPDIDFFLNNKMNFK